MGRNPFSLFWSHLFDRLPQRGHLDRQERPLRRRALIFSLLTLIPLLPQGAPEKIKNAGEPVPVYALATGAALHYQPGRKPAYQGNNDLLATAFEGSSAGPGYSEEV